MFLPGFSAAKYRMTLLLLKSNDEIPPGVSTTWKRLDLQAKETFSELILPETSQHKKIKSS